MSTQDQIASLAPWFHNIHLPDGSQTAPGHFLGDFPSYKWENIKKVIPEDLSGMKALDIGCNGGFYAIELARRGADVLAIDLDDHYLQQARWVASQFGLEEKIRFGKMQVYDLARVEETFDMVWFMGVFYHLRYPLLALDIVAQKTNGALVFQTLSVPGKNTIDVPEDIGFHQREIFKNAAYPSLSFVENRLAGDPTNWWVANHQAILAMLRNCGFRIEAMPEDETYYAVKDKAMQPDFETWNYSEFLSATGRDWHDAGILKTGEKH